MSTLTLGAESIVTRTHLLELTEVFRSTVRRFLEHDYPYHFLYGDFKEKHLKLNLGIRHLRPYPFPWSGFQ